MPPVYFGMCLLQQMTLAAIFSWWLAPLVSKGVKSKPDIPPLPFYEASRHDGRVRAFALAGALLLFSDTAIAGGVFLRELPE